MHNHVIVLTVAGACLLGACNERVSGCLDIQAANFDFSADRGDQSMCVYPDLILNVFYQWDTTSLQTDHLYQDVTGRSYAIHGVQVLFSGFVVRDDAGVDHAIEEHVLIQTGSCDSGTEQDIPDDFVFADRSAINYIIGTYRYSGLVNQFRMTVGVADTDTPLCLDALPSGHPLRAARAGYDEGLGAFALGRFIVSRDSVNALRDTLFGYSSSTDLAFDVSREFRRGHKDTLYMVIDFARIFAPVDWSLPDSVASSTLAAGIGGAVSVQ